MDFAKLPAGPNIAVLQQGLDLIRRLDDELYTPEPGKARTGSVGMQFRHGLDFYFCLLAGLESGEVDYENRQRDDRIAEDRLYAAGRMEDLVATLATLGDDDADRRIRTRGEAPAGAGHDTAPWAASSGLRELQFLFSHTVHHYAIIRLLLAARGFEAGQEFGVAPSTLRYWEQRTGHTAV
jgi:hypothetical protein